MSKLSLQEQLLKAGLVSSAQAKAVKSEKQKAQKQQQKNKIAQVDEAKLLAKKTQELKAQKDRELNEQRQEQAERKALLAQIRQLIEPNRLPYEDGDIAYHFTEQGRVKTIYVDEATRAQLSEGRLAISKYKSRYVLVSLETAAKILERDPAYLVVINTQNNVGNTDDPYAAYAVPDDLVW